MRERPKYIVHDTNLKVNFLLWIFLLGSIHSFAFQNAQIDSLKSVLQHDLLDKDRVDTYNSMAYHTYRILPDTAKFYAIQAMRLAKTSNYQKGMAKSHNSFGFIAYSQGEYDSAQWHYQQFSHLSQMIGDSASMANAQNNLGILYRNQGQLNEALLAYEKSLAIRKTMGSETGLGPIYNNLGLLHTNLGNYREGMDYYFKAIEAKRKPDRMTGRAMAYINLANLKELIDDYEGSEEAFEKAYAIYKEYNDKKGVAISFHNIAQTYSKQGFISKALAFYRKSVQINRELNNRKQLAENLNAIADLKFELTEWDSCTFYLTEAKSIADQLQIPHVQARIALSFGNLHHALGNQKLALSTTTSAFNNFIAIRTKKEISESALLLSNIYAELVDNAKALEFLKIHRDYSDSLINENKVAEIAKIEFKYDLAKVENENQKLIEAQKALDSTLSANERRLANQSQTILWGGIVFSLVIISSLFIWYFYQQARKTRNSLRAANLEISRFNQSLEQKIDERTEKIEKQNQQLMDYAFAISHEIRSPLTNLIGFLDLGDQEEIDNFSEEEKRQIKDSMANSIQKIDEATRKAVQIGHPKDSKRPQTS